MALVPGGGPPQHLCASRRAASLPLPLFLPHAVLRSPGLTAGLHGSWGPGSAAHWPLGVSKAAAAGSCGCLPESSPCSGASRQARPQLGLQGGLWPAQPVRLRLGSTRTPIFGQRTPSERGYYSE